MISPNIKTVRVRIPVASPTNAFPHTRMVREVTSEDAEASNDVVIDLMGENVEPRKDFIIANAKFVKNSDI